MALFAVVACTPQTVHAADHCDDARTDAGQLRGRIGCKHDHRL
jgi:hypothetical protein